MVKLLQKVRKHFATLVLLGVQTAPIHFFALKKPIVENEFLVARLHQLQMGFEVDLMPYLERFTMLASPVGEA